MRIAFVTNEYTTEDNFSGGIANYLHRVCLFLKEAGHDPEIFVASTKNKDIISDNIIVHQVLIPTLTTTDNLSAHPWVLTSFYLNKKLEQVNKVNNFDIVQYSNWMATGIYRLNYLPSVTRISSFQSMWVKKNNQDTSLEEKLELIALNKSDVIYCPSLFLKNVVQNYVHQNINIIETPFQIEIKKYNYSLYKSILNNKKYLLFFGQISENKGITEISEIINTLLNNNPNLYFVFVGSGDTSKLTHSQIICIPPQKHEKLYPIIQHSYAVVLPSRVDNLPNTCLEAMAHGKIVIGTRGASFEQLINNGKNGFLADKQNSNDLLATIDTVLKINPTKKLNIEKQAQKTINRLNPKNTIKKLIKFYQNTIKKHSIHPAQTF